MGAYIPTIVSLGLGLIGGVIGWIVAEFFTKPFRRGVDLVAEVRTQTLIFGNLRAKYQQQHDPPETYIETQPFTAEDAERLKKAQATLRELGARLHAFAQTEPAATLALRLFNRRILEAANALIGLSNSIDAYGSRRVYFTKQVEKALGFESLFSEASQNTPQ